MSLERTSDPNNCGTDTIQLCYTDISALVLGCAVLGVGGGGNAETGGWAARHALGVDGTVTLLTIDDLDDDDLILPLGAIGAPTISQEMIPSGEEATLILAEIQERIGRPIRAIMPTEIGGSNGVRSLGWAATLGLPLLDADGMGRAFPEMNMNSMDISGIPTGYVVLADLLGNVTTIRAVDGAWSERMARASSIASGASALLASYLMTASQARHAVIHGSISRAIRIGQLLLDKSSSVPALCEDLRGTQIIEGKLVDLERHNTGGFVRGSAVIAGSGGDKGRLVRMEIQNENLIVLEGGRCIASTPDLIVALDSDSAYALSTDELQYGQRVTVIAWPCDPFWRSSAGLLRTGPRAFGYDIDYEPIEDRTRTW